jgi:MFS transporter, OPA family, solute carrier family 37 (glycerol-3-phosphate transporter), member 1/2
VPNYVFSYACLKGCIYGLLFWLPTILDDHTGPVADQKGYISAMFDIGAVIGGLFAGFLADKFNKKALFLSPFLFCCAIIMFLISFVLGDDPFPYYLTIFLAGLFISGPYNIIGTVIAIDIGTSIKEKGSVGKISSLIEAAAAVFAMVEMIVIPYMDASVVFYLFTGEMLVATVLLIPVFLVEFRAIKKVNVTEVTQEALQE